MRDPRVEAPNPHRAQLRSPRWATPWAGARRPTTSRCRQLRRACSTSGPATGCLRRTAARPRSASRFSGVAAHHSWVARFDEDPVPIYGGRCTGRPPDDDFGAIEFTRNHSATTTSMGTASSTSIVTPTISAGVTRRSTTSHVVALRHRTPNWKHPEVPKNLDIPPGAPGGRPFLAGPYRARSTETVMTCTAADELETQILSTARQNETMVIPHLSSFIGATQETSPETESTRPLSRSTACLVPTRHNL